MQDPHAVDQTLSALEAMSWTASLPFKGHFCHATDDFNASLETEYNLFQYTTSMYKGSKHIIRFKKNSRSILRAAAVLMTRRTRPTRYDTTL